ncbi:hypothetical protein V6N12_028452 [Hibiscus sabdariffa]|uniref:Uncharacterized protein n=1 Tax=Hibiscus sabdariffa TaxID=183260 RepID=A0ABR2F5X6_9ROSI
MQVLFEQTFQKWLISNLSSTGMYDPWGCSWHLAFGAIVWSLWLNRNVLAFDVESIDRVSVLVCGKWIVEQFTLATVNSMSLRCRVAPRPRNLVHWVPPLVG